MSIRIKIKALPGSSSSSVRLHGDMIKVRIQVPPEKGKANAAIEKLLARTLGLPAAAVTITSGHSASIKTVCIDGIDRDRMLELLEHLA